MKKRSGLSRAFFIFLVMILFLPGWNTVYAYSPDEKAQLGEAELGRIQDLYNYVSNLGNENELLKDMNPKEMVESYMESGEEGSFGDSMENLILTYALRELKSVFKLLASMIIVCLMCGLLTQLQSAFSDNEVTNITYYVCYCMVLLIISNSFFVVLTLAKDTIVSLSQFMEVLMPVMIMLLAGVGGFTQAALMDPVIMLVINVSADIIVRFIFPMIILSFVLAFVNNLSKDSKVKSLSSLFSQITLWVQGLMLTVFVGIITIRGMVASSIDEVTLKTAKFTVDKFVPVIGKSLSDALATIAGYSILLKNAIGAMGIIVVVLIIVAPIIKIAIMGLMFKFSAAIIEPVSDSKIVDAVNEAGKAITLILSCVICIGIMCFIVIAIVAGTGKSIMFS